MFTSSGKNIIRLSSDRHCMSEISLTYLPLFQSCCFLQIGSALIFPARPGWAARGAGGFCRAGAARGLQPGPATQPVIA